MFQSNKISPGVSEKGNFEQISLRTSQVSGMKAGLIMEISHTNQILPTTGASQLMEIKLNYVQLITIANLFHMYPGKDMKN